MELTQDQVNAALADLRAKFGHYRCWYAIQFRPPEFSHGGLTLAEAEEVVAASDFGIVCLDWSRLQECEIEEIGTD